MLIQKVFEGFFVKCLQIVSKNKAPFAPRIIRMIFFCKLMLRLVIQFLIIKGSVEV